MTKLSEFLEGEGNAWRFAYRTAVVLWHCRGNGVQATLLHIPRSSEHPLSFDVHLLHVKRRGVVVHADIYLDALREMSWLLDRLRRDSNCRQSVRETEVSYEISPHSSGEYYVHVEVSGIGNLQVRVQYSTDLHRQRVATYEVLRFRASVVQQ